MSELIRLELTPEEAHVLHDFIVNALQMFTTAYVLDAGTLPVISKEQTLANMQASIEAFRHLGLVETVEYLKECAKTA